MENGTCTDSAKISAQAIILLRNMKFNTEEITLGVRKNQFYKIF